MPSNRRPTPPRAGSYLALACLVGLLIGAGWIAVWYQYGLTAQQRTMLPLYAKSSFPYPATVDVSKYFANVPAKRRYLKGPIRFNLRAFVYENKNFLQVFKIVAIGFASIFSVSFLAGLILYQRRLNVIRGPRRLRGSRFKTIRELNKTVKGPVFHLRVKDMPEDV